MGTIECSQPASKSSWDSQDFGDISMVLKWLIFASPAGPDELIRDVVETMDPEFSNVTKTTLWQFTMVTQQKH